MASFLPYLVQVRPLFDSCSQGSQALLPGRFDLGRLGKLAQLCIEARCSQPQEGVLTLSHELRLSP